jgi:hypothetical protein
MEPLSTERWVEEIAKSKIRVICALRLALTALHDADNDIAMISPCVHSRPKEVRDAQIKAWNIVGRLLGEAAKSIKAYRVDDLLGEVGLRDTIRECEEILRLKSEDDREENLKPLLEKIRKFKDRKRKPGT